MAFKAEFRAPPPLLAASQQPIKSLAVMKKSGGNDQGIRGLINKGFVV